MRGIWRHITLIVGSMITLNLASFAEDTNTIDSLKKVIETTDDGDTIKVTALLLWDKLIYVSDPDLDLELNMEILLLNAISVSRLYLPELLSR